jgi:ELWxxDGT repeat protein
VFFEVPTGNAIDGTLQVMMTDGTSAGTMLMPGLSQDASGMQVTNNPVAAPNGIYFQARTILHGSELWFWDGAAPEPRLVNDLRPGPDSSAPAPLAIVDGWIYYNANDGQSGRELWALDTTNLPTVQSEIVTDRSAGVAPLTVKFSTAPSMAAISFAWDFGDGSTSTEAKPTHIFATPGQYTVQLVFSDDYGQQTLTHIITVYAPVKAAFTVRPDQGNAPLTVHFTGQASGDFTSLEWDFGDGVTSSEPNPSHSYSISGVYT